MKKLFLFLVGLISWVNSFAADFSINGITYDLQNMSGTLQARVINVTNSIGGSTRYSLTIPKSIIYSGQTYPVTIIKEGAFDNLTEIGYLTLEGDVLIGNKANTALSTANILPNHKSTYNLIIKGDETASRTNFTQNFPKAFEITFSDNVENVQGCKYHPTLNNAIFKVAAKISSEAFIGCTKLTQIHFEKTIATVNKNAFKNCSKLDVIWGQFCIDAKEGAFAGCPLTQNKDNFHLGYSVDDKGYDAVADRIYIIDHNTTESIYNTKVKVLKFDTESEEDVTISSDFFPLSNYAIERVQLPSLGYTGSSFEHYTTIGDYAFANCPKLNTVWGSATYIGAHAFEGLKLTGSKSCESLWWAVQYIGEAAFKNAKMYRSNFNNTMKNFFEMCEYIGDEAFLNCRDEDGNRFFGTTIGPATKIIGNHAFDGTFEEVILKSNDLTRGDNVEYSPDYNLRTIFGDKEKTWYYFDEGIKNIGDFAMFRNNPSFDDNANIELGKDIITIGLKAFNDCNSLKSINLPNIRSIDAHAFYFCHNLKTIVLSTLGSTYPTMIECNAFEGVNPTSVKIYGKNTLVCEDAINTYNLETIIDESDKLKVQPKDKNTVIITGTEAKAKEYKAGGYKYSTSLQRISHDVEDVNMDGGLSGDDAQAIYNAMK